jgi:hypothetical protein
MADELHRERAGKPDSYCVEINLGQDLRDLRIFDCINLGQDLRLTKRPLPCGPLPLRYSCALDSPPRHARPRLLLVSSSSSTAYLLYFMRISSRLAQ